MTMLDKLRLDYDRAYEAFLGWGRLPDEDRTTEKLTELKAARRAADVALAREVRKEKLARKPERAIEDVVREAGGTVL